MSTISLDDFILRNNGKYIDYDNAYGAQCVDLARFYWQLVCGLSKQPRGVVGAKDFWSNYNSDPVLKENFDRIANTPDFIPKKGDVMIWKHGQYGHIAVVASDNNDLNYFYAFSQNDPLNSPCKIIKYSYANVYGVLRPRKANVSCLIPNDNEGSKLFNKLVHNSGLADGVVQELGLAEKADDVSLDTVKKSLAAREGKLTTCTNTLSTREKELAEVRQEVKNREEQISRVTETLTNEVNDWKQRYDAIKQSHKLPEEIEQGYVSRIEQLQSSLDQEAKEKGRALNDLAGCKAELENAQKGIISRMSFVEILKLLLASLQQ